MAQVVRSMSMNRDTDPPQGKPKRTSKALAVVVVGLTHVVLGLWLGHLAPEVETEEPLQAIAVDLVRPVPPPMPEPLPASPKEGGGAAAAKSAVRPTPPREKMPPPEIEAPPVTSSEPPLVIGVAEKESVRPGQGQGGEGSGTGRGEGSGSGDGRGSGPQFISGPSQAQIRSLHPREAFRRRQGGRVQLICRLRADTRLEACRVVSETPQNAGFGTAALAAAQYFRFRPASREGHPVDGAEIAVGVEWP